MNPSSTKNASRITEPFQLGMNGRYSHGELEPARGNRKRCKHAMVYLRGAPLVFGAQLSQEEQIRFRKSEDKENTFTPKQRAVT